MNEKAHNATQDERMGYRTKKRVKRNTSLKMVA